MHVIKDTCDRIFCLVDMFRSSSSWKSIAVDDLYLLRISSDCSLVDIILIFFSSSVVKVSLY